MSEQLTGWPKSDWPNACLFMYLYDWHLAHLMFTCLTDRWTDWLTVLNNNLILEWSTDNCLSTWLLPISCLADWPSHDWLTDGSTDWLTDWLTYWLVTDWLADWWLTNWLTDDWLVIGWLLTNWLTGDWLVIGWLLTNWLTGDWWLTDCWLTDWLLTDW